MISGSKNAGKFNGGSNAYCVRERKRISGFQAGGFRKIPETGPQ
jgi:hypothetical protein